MIQSLRKYYCISEQSMRMSQNLGIRTNLGGKIGQHLVDVLQNFMTFEKLAKRFSNILAKRLCSIL